MPASVLKENPDAFHQLTLALAAAGLSASLSGEAQTPPTANPLDTVPDTMPFDVPYGAPISLDTAASAIAAAVAEAKKHDWKLNVAVGRFGVPTWFAFQRMDGAQLRRSRFSHHKARAAPSFRRETRVMEDGVQLKAELLHPHARRRDCLARWDPSSRQGKTNRRDRLLGVCTGSSHD